MLLCHCTLLLLLPIGPGLIAVVGYLDTPRSLLGALRCFFFSRGLMRFLNRPGVEREIVGIFLADGILVECSFFWF